MEATSFRFDPTPVSGQSKGLLLVLDGHNDLVTASSVQDYFQVQISYVLINSSKQHNWLQGLEAIIDTTNDYPLSARNKVLLKPGHLVSQ